MPIIYDLETDIRFLQGVEKEARKQTLLKEEAIIKMLKDDALSTQKIATYMDVSIEYVNEIKKQLES